MPTIKDIAKISGVSHGTVSNVLNGRGNVSVKKIKLVETAAKQLGYQINLQAKILKEGSSKTISVVLPNITSEQYSNLYDSLFSNFNEQGYEITLYLTHDSTERELQLLQKIALKRDVAVIAVSCLLDASCYYQTINISKHNIIFVYRKPKAAAQFISLDFEQAGQDIASVMIQNNYKNIGLFSNSDKHTHSSSFKKGLLSYFESRSYTIDLTHIESVPSDGTYNLAFNFFVDDKIVLDAIITTDVERAHYIRNANYLGSLNHCPPIYTLANNSFFYEDNIYQYHMNYGVLGQQILNIIENKKIIKITNKGFTLLPDAEFRKSHVPQNHINLLTLASPSTEAVKKLLPHLKKTTGINVNLIIKPFNDIYHIINELEKYQNIDIIRIDMASLPWFASTALKPLDELNIDYKKIFSAYSPQLIKRFSYINNTAYATPFDPSLQMLFYRKDLFNNPLIKRAYFEKFKQHLDVPKNFKEFNQIVKFFDRNFNSESLVEFGSCVTLGNPEIIASEFLLRYYANGGKLIANDVILLNKNIALSTLEEFQEYIKIAKNLDSNWWQESVNQFETGQLAMLIVYMNLFTYVNHRNILPLIGYAMVPGNKPLFGGGSLGMSKYSQKNDEVSTFFNWLYSKEISEQVALLGGTIMGNFQNQRIIDSYPWLNTVQENYSSGIRENYFDNNNAIDLRKVENIIGSYLSDWLKGHYDHKQVIDKINAEL